MIEGLNFGKKSFQGRYKYQVDPDIAELYAKERCKTCYGKGYLVYQTGVGTTTIRNDRPILQRLEYCSCTRKNVRKYN